MEVSDRDTGNQVTAELPVSRKRIQLSLYEGVLSLRGENGQRRGRGNQFL